MRLRLHVRIEKSTNHALILRMVPRCFGFEEFDTLLAQCQRDFYSLFAKSQLGRRRKKIGDDANRAQQFIGVFDFRAHSIRALTLRAALSCGYLNEKLNRGTCHGLVRRGASAPALVPPSESCRSRGSAHLTAPYTSSRERDRPPCNLCHALGTSDIAQRLGNEGGIAIGLL